MTVENISEIKPREKKCWNTTIAVFIFFLTFLLMLKYRYYLVIKSTVIIPHLRIQSSTSDTYLRSCKHGINLVGPIGIDESPVKDFQELENMFSVQNHGHVQHGGWYKPKDCKPLNKVAIIVPYRNRVEQLKLFLRHMHPMLRRQRLYYKIFVVDQVGDDPFCRGTLFNIGFKEALKMLDYECFVFADVDLLPENDRNHYGCPTSPRHMSASIDIFNYIMINEDLFGGCGAFTRSHFENVNGFSNLFFGWGGEDDDLLRRLKSKGYRLTRPSMKDGRYKMIQKNHFRSSPPYEERWELLKTSAERMPTDGLNTLKYRLVGIVEEPLVTFIKVEIKKSMYIATTNITINAT